jgi:hypothetical protein
MKSIGLSMKKVILLLLLALPFTTCKKDGVPTGRCLLKPDAGNCKAYMPRYYYDQKEKRCKEFIYGGCGGVVPFETLEACKQCECRQLK